MAHPFNNLVSFFPDEQGKKPRPGQKLGFKQIEEGLNAGKRVFIIRAPTGSGKSYIAKTAANATDACIPRYKEMIENREAFAFDEAGGGYVAAGYMDKMPFFGASIMTVTKALQDQYESDFPDIATFKGKSNYPCMVDDMFDCSFAPCTMSSSVKKDCLSQKTCLYFNKQEESAKTKINALNYSVLFTLPSHIARRQLYIFDEASEIEKELVSANAIEIDLKYLGDCGVHPNGIPSNKKIGAWCNDVIDDITNILDAIVNEFKQAKKKSTALINKHKYLSNMAAKLTGIQSASGAVDYVVTISDDNRFLKIQPLKVAYFAQKIFKNAEYVMLMSATIIDPHGYAARLGLKPEEYHIVDIPSTFDPAKSPIYFSDKLYLSYKTMEASLPKLTDMVQMICDSHPKEKGIIHTHNMQITAYFQNKLKGTRFLFRDKDSKNEAILEQHVTTNRPTVLTTPSMTHGYDLKDELARFQIVAKAPFAPMSDLRVKTLAAEDPQWYADQMLSTFIQSCGRGTRNEEDHCVTYVLDAALKKAVEANMDKLPPDFVARIEAANKK